MPPDLTTPLSAMLARAADMPERVAFFFDDDPWTYAKLRRETERLAGAMHGEGVRPGDRVILHMLNHPEIIVSYLASFWIGAVGVPVSPRFKASELQGLVRRVRPSLYLGQADVADALDQLTDEDLGTKHRFAIGEADEGGRARPWSDLFSGQRSTEPVAPELRPDAAAILFSTSGTTGTSKLVVWTGRTVAAVGRASLSRCFSDGDIVLNASPMVHASGIDNWARCLFNALPMVMMRTFEPGAALDAVERHRCTFFAHLPYTFSQLVEHQHAQPRDLTSLRACIAWGDACPPDTAAAFRDVTGIPLLSMWSSTEDAGSGAPAREPGPFTRFVPAVEMRLVDEAGHAVPDGETGELEIRSPATSPGYWTGVGTVDEMPGGWFSTGDLLQRDASERFRTVGRKKQLIVREGSNISPAEVENLLRDDPAVSDAVVFGVDDRELGQRVMATAVLRAGTADTAEQILDRVRVRLADYKVPERLVITDAIPRNSSGKVDREAAAAAARDAHLDT